MAQTYSQIWIHLVWSTKNRTPVLTKEIRHKLFQHICSEAERKGYPIDSINGLADHIHILICLNPKFSISTVVKNIKGESSRWLNENEVTEEGFQWQDGFSAFSVSKTVVPKVRKYIQEQEIKHAKMNFEEEIKLFQRTE